MKTNKFHFKKKNYDNKKNVPSAINVVPTEEDTNYRIITINE